MNRLLLCVLLLAAVVGCREDDPFELPPPDGAPAVRRVAPAVSSSLNSAGDVVSFSFSFSDNEQLARWTLLERRLTNLRYLDTTLVVSGVPRDTALLRADTVYAGVAADETLSGNEVTKAFSYTVPVGDPLMRVELLATVFDNKGASDSTLYVLTVDFERTDSLAQHFEILSYTGDTLYNGLSAVGPNAFNLVARAPASNVAARDIEETTTTVGAFSMALRSPNTAPNDVFVVVKPAEFNYDSLTYAILRQTFLSRIPSATTGQLQVGDVVILQMSLVHEGYNNWNHFAAIRIREIVAVGNNQDYIVFDYKRSDEL